MYPLQPRGGWIIALSILVAFLLTAVPLPEWAAYWRPAWIPMVLMYWGMALPSRVGIYTGWCLGILLDVLRGTLLGQHAAGLTLVAFIIYTAHRRIRVFPLAQQALVIGVILSFYLLLMIWIRSMAGQAASAAYLFSALTSMLLWPWLFIVLRDVRRKWRIS